MHELNERYDSKKNFPSKFHAMSHNKGIPKDSNIGIHIFLVPEETENMVTLFYSSNISLLMGE